jgi:peptidoglycan hydrolase-like protein with peptidoglycan-binding domain
MIKKFLIGTFALALVLSVGVLTADAFSGATLRVGSKGADVIELQTKLGLTADGSFGPMTKAAVMAFQASNGLTADGIAGPMTLAKMSAAVVGGTYPAGCTSNTGFSSTTGQSCAVVVTTLPAGCTSTAGFSSTTGAKCDGAVVGTTGPLVGAEGDITVSDFTSGTQNTLGEGKSEKVLGVKVEADNGSDVSLSTMKVVIDGFDDGVDNLGSTRLERHIDSVDVYMGSTKVGSADVSDFSKDSGVYTKSVSLSNAVIRKGEDAKFYVSVTAASSIDSENEDNTWDVGVTSIRFQDAMGVVTTVVDGDASFDVAPVTVDFESATANDEITSASSSNNPEATTLKVKDNDTSDEYLVFAFKLKADKDSTDLNVLEIPITVTSGVDADEAVNDIYLKVGSTVYDNYDLAGDIYTFTIDEGDLTIDGDSSVEVKVYASFNEEGLVTTYTTGEDVTFSLDASTLVVENVDGDSVSTALVTDRSGNEMILSTSSTLISGVTTGSDIDADGKVGTYTFKFTVEADGADVTLSNATIVETVSQSVVPAFSIKKDSGTATGTLGTSYVVSDGDTASFTVTYTVDPGAPATTGIYYVTIDTIDGVSVDETAGPETITTI